MSITTKKLKITECSRTWATN